MTEPGLNRRPAGVSSPLVSDRELELRIEESGTGHVARLESVDLGEATADVLPEPLAPFLAVAERRRDAIRDEGAPGDVGEALTRAVLHGEARALLRASLREVENDAGTLRVVLRVDGAGGLARLPWELLRDPDTGAHLALREDVTFVRYSEQLRPRPPLAVDGPLRVLLASASPRGLAAIDGEGEARRVEAALRPLATGGALVVEHLPGATLAEVLERLREGWHVLHLIAHGRAGGDGAIVLEDRRGGADAVPSRDLAGVLAGDGTLRLVVLNACDGASPAAAAPFLSIAQRLVRSGVPAVMAMQGPISDAAAVEFAAALYRELARRRPVDAAVAAGRRRLHAETTHRRYFGTPVLYLRALQAQLFAAPAPAVAAPRPPRRRVPERGWWPWAAGLAIAASIAGVVALAAVVRERIETADAAAVDGDGVVASSLLRGPEDDEGPGLDGDPRCPSPPGLDLPLRLVPGGRFVMGSADGAPDERPPHEVAVDAFCLGVTEVTQGQWRAVMGDLPTLASPDPRLPMGRVTWEEARAYVERLNARAGDAAGPFRLPTEAEWERAARAGAATAYAFGDDPADLPRHGNCLSARPADDGHDGPAPVASFVADRWGLHDLHGNLSEWVADRYRPYPGADPTDPVDPNRRVRRGGSYETRPENCRAATRNHSDPTYRSPDVGFRVARDPLPGDQGAR